jgi:hypothetical protein
LGITGQSYVSDHVVINAAGTMTSLTRYHADGTREYNQTLDTDGSKSYNKYDATGHLTQSSIVHTDGSLDLYDYEITGESYVRDHIVYDSAGHVTSTTRFHADGTLDFNQTVSTDGTRTTNLFDSAGARTETLVIQSNGPQIVTAYAAGLTLTSSTSNDIFTGFQNDTFVFHANSGNDIINGFHAGDLANHDVIQIDQTLVADFSHLTMGQQGSDVVIAIDAQDSITLKNTSLLALTPGDFVFS